MQPEEFETIRDFEKNFPSKMYICSRCGRITTNPRFCINCDNQSNNFLFSDKTYTYKIVETGKTEQIFKPIELEKGQNNG